MTELLSGYFSGELPDRDRQKVEQWRDRSPENLKLFEDYRSLWNSFEKASGLYSLDLDQEWQKLRVKTTDLETPVISINTRRQKSLWLKIAATIVLIGTAAMAFFMVISSRQPVTVLSENSVKVVTLPDGSRVTLNRNAVLAYGRNYGNVTRKVSLSGEAYFEVEHNPDKKFIVNTAFAGVEVTGTSFSVTAKKDSGAAEVVVSSGTVLFYNKNRETEKVILQAGNKGIISGKNGKPEKIDSADMNFLAWKTGKLVFKNDSLGYVIDVLNHTYRTRVEINNKILTGCRITVSFNNQSLDDVLEIIQSTLGLKVTRQKNIYIIDGPGC